MCPGSRTIARFLNRAVLLSLASCAVALTCAATLFCAVTLSCAVTLAQETPPLGVARCAVIGGLSETDFWSQLADRFQRDTGLRAEIAVVGPKQAITAAMRAGDADLAVMHVSDAIINLVADGYCENPQPWARNDYVIVGPPEDPAEIRGEADAVTALRKIIASRAKFMLHASHGAGEIVSDLLAAGELELDAKSTLSQPGDRHRQMLTRAAEERAYTLVGRIPFVNGKLERSDLEIMVQGDERLRRPYLVVVARGEPGNPRLIAARRLAAYLREPATQDWLSQFGKGKFDQHPLLFPVVVSR